jgi:hypothetical protein
LAENKKIIIESNSKFEIIILNDRLGIGKIQLFNSSDQESRREGWTDACSAVGFCLGSGLFGSYNSD